MDAQGYGKSIKEGIIFTVVVACFVGAVIGGIVVWLFT